MFTPTSIRHRATIFILLPAFLLLCALEFFGFHSIKNMVFQQMVEANSSHLERTAHFIDSRLRRPKQILNRLETAPSEEVRTYLTNSLKGMDGIIDIHFFEPDNELKSTINGENDPKLEYSHYFPQKTIALSAKRVAVDGNLTPTSELTISFFDLIGHIPNAPWWGEQRTFIIDLQGNMLLPGDTIGPYNDSTQSVIPEAIQEKLLLAIKNNNIGSVTTDDDPTSDTIYGYLRLKEAPWAMVISANGATLLQPLLTFRRTYIVLSLIATVAILFLMNVMLHKVLTTIRKLSKAAARLAEGYFDSPLQLSSRDELGELVSSFNTMSSQLKKGVQLNKAMALAGEVQRNLLRESHFKNNQVEVCGISIPCEETGGDYFDIIPPEDDHKMIAVVVGDVVGHGVGAALLMATTRALIRSQISVTDNLATCAVNANKLLCRDTEPTGNFVTTFMFTMDMDKKTISWVRAGHEPAILYSTKDAKITELRGKGLALGIANETSYNEYKLQLPSSPCFIIIGTDGVTDAENVQGERFGRKRLESFIVNNNQLSSQKMVQALQLELETFSGNRTQHDDITLAIIKTN